MELHLSVSLLEGMLSPLAGKLGFWNDLGIISLVSGFMFPLQAWKLSCPHSHSRILFHLHLCTRETFEPGDGWTARKLTESDLPSSFPFASPTPVAPRGVLQDLKYRAAPCSLVFRKWASTARGRTVDQGRKDSQVMDFRAMRILETVHACHFTERSATVKAVHKATAEPGQEMETPASDSGLSSLCLVCLM